MARCPERAFGGTASFILVLDPRKSFAAGGPEMPVSISGTSRSVMMSAIRHCLQATIWRLPSCVKSTCGAYVRLAPKWDSTMTTQTRSGAAIDRKSLSGPALRTFSRIAQIWKLTTDEQMILLGRSEEHTSELQSLMRISYAVF